MQIYVSMMRRLREAGITQKYIAEQCGVDPAAVRRWSKGIATPSKAPADKIQWMVAIIAANGADAKRLRREGASMRGKAGQVHHPKPPPAFDARRIQRLLETNGWSQSDLSKLCAVSRWTVSKWVSGTSGTSDAADHLLAQLEANPPTREEVDATLYLFDRIGASRVAAIKEALSLDNNALARAVGVGTHTLTQWVNGNKTPSGAAVRLLRNLEIEAGIINKKE